MQPSQMLKAPIVDKALISLRFTVFKNLLNLRGVMVMCTMLIKFGNYQIQPMVCWH